MFIIAGTKGKAYKAGYGSFYCSNCKAEREYTHYEVRRIATLFFVPVAKMGMLGEYIVCNHCDAGYEMSAIDYDPEEERDMILQIYEKAVRRAMVMMMLIDGKIEDSEIKTIQEVYAEVLNDDGISEEEIEEVIAACKDSPESVTDYIREITPYIRDDGKELLLESIYRISISNGDINSRELKMMKLIAKIMAISSSHLKGIIAEVEQDS